jgi:hypothetical protein
VQDSAVPQNVPTAVTSQAELKEPSRIIPRMSLRSDAAIWGANPSLPASGSERFGG